MTWILDCSVDTILEAVEAAAARGKRGAEPLLRMLLEEEARTGELSVISRLAAKRDCGAAATQTNERHDHG